MHSNCTTTTSTTTGGKNADGTDKPNSTTSQQATKTQQDYCRENPTAAMCVGTDTKQSAWNGTCAGGFTCSGDAVQCATAKAVWDQNCLMNTETAQGVHAGALLNGQDQTLNPVEHPSTMDLGTIDSSEPFGASCPSDVSFSAFGHSFSFKLWPICSMAEKIAPLVVMSAVLAAMAIVAAGINS